VQLAHAAGLTAIGTAGTEAGRALVREQGAGHALDHNDPGLEKQLMDLTGGRGVDIVVEMLANKNLAIDLRLVARRGRIVVVGSRGPVEINPRDAMVREASILGTFLFGMSAAELSSAHAALHAALENGTVRPVVGRSLPLAEARKAHELSRARPGRSCSFRSPGCSRTRSTTSPRDSRHVRFRKSTGRTWRICASARGTSTVSVPMKRLPCCAPASGG
jgi:NADPH:quinone reductase-like Zn-dependent oxidoreductase